MYWVIVVLHICDARLVVFQKRLGGMLDFCSSFSFCPLYFIHPLPPAGYSRLSQGESFGYSVVTDCPSKLGGEESL